LFVATPLLIIPLVALAQFRYTAEEIGLVGMLGARGHHLPGMLRAYGDRELFSRFRVRFIVAPIFLLAVCGWFARSEGNTLDVALLLWGLWHGLAQVYGFMRIYDAKVGARSRWRGRMDMSMCVVWFTGGVLYSPEKVADILKAFYQSGMPLLPSPALDQIRIVWNVLAAIITAGFVVYTLVRWWEGEPCSVVKLFAMTTSIAFWWYAMVYLKEIILGVAVFEIFHDVQYLSIVWVFNRTRVDKGRPVGAFTRFLFRPSTIMMALYVGLVVAYGCASELNRVFAGEENVKNMIYAAALASTFLHFYYDGFIWKIREPTTSEGLKMQGGNAAGSRLRTWGWLVHGLKWSAFVIPIAWSLIYPRYGGISKLELRQALVASVPDCPSAHATLADELAHQGNAPEAQAQYEKAVQLNPNYAVAHNNLGNVLAQQKQYVEAMKHYERALQLRPDYQQASDNLRQLKELFQPQSETSRQW